MYYEKEKELEDIRLKEYFNKQTKYFETHEALAGTRLIFSVIICIFFGWLGIHNFINRNYKKGRLQLILALASFFIISLCFKKANLFLIGDISLFATYFHIYFTPSLIWAGYDLFLMCWGRYFIPISNSDTKLSGNEYITNHFKDQNGGKIKYELGNKNKGKFLFLSLFTPLGIENFYAKYHNRAVVAILLCIGTIIPYISPILSYYHSVENQNADSSGLFNVMFTTLYFSYDIFLFKLHLIFCLIIYSYFILLALQEKFDGKDKLLNPHCHLFMEVFLKIIVGIIWITVYFASINSIEYKRSDPINNGPRNINLSIKDLVIGSINSHNYHIELKRNKELENQKIIDLDKQVSEKGDKDAAEKLGDIYLNGRERILRDIYGDNELRDPQKAIEWYKKSFELGNKEIAMKLANLYEFGKNEDVEEIDPKHGTFGNFIDIKILSLITSRNSAHNMFAYSSRRRSRKILIGKDPTKAIEWYTKAFEQGNKDAAYRLGSIYNKIEDAESNEKSFIWYSKAKGKSDEEIAEILGDRYLDGDRGNNITKNSEKAVEWYIKAFEQGNKDVAIKLGNMYAKGIGVSKDPIKADEFYSLALENKNLNDNPIKIGDMYLNGNGVPKDSTKAIAWYTKIANVNNIAPMKIADIYYNGNGIPNDIEKAIEWYKKASEMDNKDAAKKLGDIYRYENKDKKDPLKSVEWYIQAAKRGDYVASKTLYYMYLHGEGVSKDPVKAVEWYTRTLSVGKESTAAWMLGDIYSNGEFVPKDLKKAAEYYSKAAQLGGYDYSMKLGNMYLEGTIIQYDPIKAIEWYTEAYNKGFYMVSIQLGEIYSNGKHIPIDPDKAIEWYKKGIDRRYSNGAIKIGDMYLEGNGISKDPIEAIEWYKKAFEMLNREAGIKIGDIYLEGKDVFKDSNKAIEWYSKAANAGNKKASLKLGDMYLEGKDIPKNPQEAIKWYTKVVESENWIGYTSPSEQSNGEAQFKLGIIYFEGKYVPKDTKKGFNLIQDSAQKGNKDAIDFLEKHPDT